MAIIAADRELKISFLPHFRVRWYFFRNLWKIVFKLKKIIKIIWKSTPLVINDLHLYPTGYWYVTSESQQLQLIKNILFLYTIKKKLYLNEDGYSWREIGRFEFIIVCQHKVWLFIQISDINRYIPLLLYKGILL